MSPILPVPVCRGRDGHQSVVKEGKAKLARRGRDATEQQTANLGGKTMISPGGAPVSPVDCTTDSRVVPLPTRCARDQMS